MTGAEGASSAAPPAKAGNNNNAPENIKERAANRGSMNQSR
jgi:hypothetical protein